MAHNSARLNISIPDASDQVNLWPTNSSSQISTLDNALMYSKGTIASRPSVGSVVDGYIYACTDVSAVFLASNGAWQYLPPNGGVAPVAAVQQYIGSSDPVDADGVTRWLVMDGRAISRTTYAALFAKISTTYGAGNGSTTFNIPNAQQLVLVGVGGGYTLGSTGGEATHTLSTTEMPTHAHGVNETPHSHGFTNSNGVGAVATIANAGWAQFEAAASGATGEYVAATTTPLVINNVLNTAGANTSISTQNNGSGGAHNNVQPYLAVNHILRVL